MDREGGVIKVNPSRGACRGFFQGTPSSVFFFDDEVGVIVIGRTRTGPIGKGFYHGRRRRRERTKRLKVVVVVVVGKQIGTIISW